MDMSPEIGDFSGVCRLFPLPNLVLLPHVILPLHIFEPRYRQMTHDALEGDRLVTIVQACPGGKVDPWVEPVPIADVACIGKIVQHERLPDGRFNMLLLGCHRVRLVRELPSPKLYRVAEAEILEDRNASDLPDRSRDELIRLFLLTLQSRRALDPDFLRLLESDLPLGCLCDIMAHALDLPTAVKQTLLEETLVDRRASVLNALLQALADQLPGPRRFPHPFSLN